MVLQFWSLGLLFLLPATQSLQKHQHEQKYPCAFIDTINITSSSTVQVNSSTMVTFPSDLVAYYDFVIENGVRRPAERHLRACVCKLKPCIRFCCAPGHYYDLAGNRSCSQIATAPFGFPDQSVMEMQWSNGTRGQVQVADHFTVHTGAPCDRMRFGTKTNEILPWTLYENGTIAFKNQVFSKHYCYTPIKGKQTHRWLWQPLACAPEKFRFILGVKEWTYAICLIIAAICMGITFLVYLMCTEMRNAFYGVAIKCYSLCTITGYALLAHLTLTDPSDMSSTDCETIPCFALLFLLLSFYILSFVSLNFYLSFQGVVLTKVMFWLLLCPIVLLAVGWSVFVSLTRFEGRPILGGETCWFDPRTWSIMVYFYAPIFVACILAGFFYLLTHMHISDQQQESDINKVAARIEVNRFQSFWKFFLYTFAAWLVNAFSFALHYYHGEKTHINYSICFFATLHGFGALYALIGQNQQIQNFLRRINEEEDVDDDDENEMSVPMNIF